MNIDTLLSPISETSACGEDLSFSEEFDAIQESRRADDPTLDQGEWVTALKLADWPGVVAQCEKVFARSKDLRVAGWLTEANARTSGYAGLADGLELCRLLCEHFWADLHPQLDDDGDAEQRIGNLRWLLNTVEALATQLPVLRQGDRSFSLRDIDSAQAATRAGERSEDGASAANAITQDDIAAARRATPREFFAANFLDAQRAQQELVQLQSVIDANLGVDGPGFTGAKGALENATHLIGLLAREISPGSAVLKRVLSDGSPAATVAAPSQASDAGGPLSNRADALRQLREVAEFFRRTEPHSPVAYLAERAAQWGEMPLHEWLRAVVKDQSALSNMEELLGVEPPPSRDA